MNVVDDIVNVRCSDRLTTNTKKIKLIKYLEMLNTLLIYVL